MVAWAAALVFAAAAARDLGWRVIDNRLVILSILLWGVFAAMAGWGWQAVALNAGIGVLAFAVTLGFYLLGWLGGGDVKLAAAVFLWAGHRHGIAILVLVALAGTVLGIVGLAANWLARLRMPPALGFGLGLISSERGVPYGIALSLGGAVAALAVIGNGG
ncbi:MAG TPA: prepilin peptidase [Magnetospirillum sp.]|jgi:prepilin peptidase CpaA|nr:prepilin peptidase [Magnetospirillum sp.]